MLKRILSLLLLAGSFAAHAQTAVLPIYVCTQAGVQAKTSGLVSTNYLQGVIPSCLVTVYLTGTTTLATTTPQSPFIANTNGSIPPIYAAINQGYDVVLSGGIAPNTYPSPVTFTGLYPVGSGGGGCPLGTCVDGQDITPFTLTLSGYDLSESSTTIGTETTPYTSSDGTAGIQSLIDRAATTHGGTVTLAPSAYSVSTAPRISTPGITLDGTFAYGTDGGCGGGCQTGVTGTKITVTSTNGPGLAVGNPAPSPPSRLGGVYVHDLYFTGSNNWTGSQVGLTVDYDTDQTHFHNLNFDSLSVGMQLTGGMDSPSITNCSMQAVAMGIQIGTGTSLTRLAKIDGCVLGQDAYYGIFVGQNSIGAILTNIVTGSDGAATYISVPGSGNTIAIAGQQTALYDSTVGNAGYILTANEVSDGVGILNPATNTVVNNTTFYQNVMGADIHVSGGSDAVLGPNNFTYHGDLNYLITGGGATVLRVPQIYQTVCNLISNTYIDAPNGYTASCPVPAVDGVSGVWSATATTITNATADGSLVALAVPSTANTAHSVISSSTAQGLPIPANTVLPSGYYDLTANVKAAGYNFAALKLTTASGTLWGFANLTTCAAGTVDAGLTFTAASVAVESGVTGFCALNATTTGTITSVEIAPATADNVRSFAGNGTSGIEVGSVYIPENAPRGTGSPVFALSPAFDGVPTIGYGTSMLKLGDFSPGAHSYSSFRTDTAGGLDISAGSAGGMSIGFDNPTLVTLYGAGDVIGATFDPATNQWNDPSGFCIGTNCITSWSSGNITGIDAGGTPVTPTVGVVNFTGTSPIVATPTGNTIDFSCPTCGVSGGGTTVTVNGGSSLGSLNINAATPSPDASNMALTPKISGANMIVEQHVADSSDNGYLSSTNWSTFNGKQNALTNPVTGPGSGATVGHLAVMNNTSGTLIADGGVVPSVGTWGALNYPTWASGSPFVKMTAAGTFALDTNTYDLSGAAAARAGTGSCTAGQFETGDTTSGPSCDTPAGAGTVTTTGSPSSGQLAEFSGGTSITSATQAHLGALINIPQYSIPYSAGTAAALTDVASPTVNGTYAMGWVITGSAALAPTAINVNTLVVSSASTATTATNATNAATTTKSDSTDYYLVLAPANSSSNQALDVVSATYHASTGATTLPAGGSLGSSDTGTPRITFGTNSVTVNKPLTLGAAGTLGSVTFGNATSGLLTLEPATGAITSYTLQLPVAQPSGANTYLSCTAANPSVCTFAAGGSGSGLSGMTSGQVPLAASASTVTSSKALAGTGAGITTGPASGVTSGNAAIYTGTGGQIADAGYAPAAALPNCTPETSAFSFATNACYRFTGSGAVNATSPASSSAGFLAAIYNAGTAAVTIVTGGPTLACVPSSCIIPVGASASITTIDGTGLTAQISNANGSAFGTLANASAINNGNWSGTQLAAGNGGTGVVNTATLTLGSSNQNWATLGTGIVKNTITTGALSDAGYSDVVSLWASGSCSGYLKSDGTCATPGGGTVTVVGSGNLTSTALVTGGGTTTLQTPSTTSTLSSGGALQLAAGGSVGSADSGTPTLTFATNKGTFNQPLNLGTASNQLVTGTLTNLTTSTYPASSGAVTLTFPNTTEYMVGANSDTTTTHVAHATAVAGVANFAAIAYTDLPTGTGSNQVVLGGTIAGAGPTGGATSIPVITYNAAGQLTTVTTATPTVSAVNGVSFGAGAAAGTIPDTTSSSAASWTATPTLGAAGTLGSLTMGNATSGLLTIEPITGALGTITEYFPIASGDTLIAESASSSNTAYVLHATAGAGIGTFSAIAAADLPAALSSSTSINKVTVTAPATGSTLTVADGTTLSNTYTMNAAKTAGVAGAIPWYDTTTSESASALLTQYGVMIGGGASAAPSTIAASTTTTQALFATATAPAFRAIAATDLPTANRIIPCGVGIWGGGSAIVAATYHVNARCLNVYGVTYTITGVTCQADNSGTSTANVADSGSNALLTGAITMNTANTFVAGTQSATTTIASNVWTNWTFVADGTSTSIQCVMTTTR